MADGNATNMAAKPPQMSPDTLFFVMASINFYEILKNRILLYLTIPSPPLICIKTKRMIRLSNTVFHSEGVIMKANVGGIDRVLRILVGAVLVALAVTGTVGAWGYLGLIVLATGVFSFCGAYTLLGINTCPIQAEEEPSS
jgi:hypothetical protein